jgi:DNA polymerase III delta prime subunit
MSISFRDQTLLEKLFLGFRSGRLAHAFIVHSTDLDYGRAFLAPLAQAILETQQLTHPDLLRLKPSGSMAQIKTEEARSLVQRLQQTPLVGSRKVVWIEEAERCPPSAANVFLKTLEEAPPQTYFFLLSSHPAKLLSTIRSRCFVIRLQGISRLPQLPSWEIWKQQLSDYLSALLIEKRPSILPIFPLYALLASLESLINQATNQTSADATLPEETNETALRSLQQVLWADLEHFITNILYRPAKASIFKQLPAIVAFLEKCHGLSELNLPFTSAMEAWLIFTAQTLIRLEVS